MALGGVPGGEAITPREAEVLDALGENLTNAEIAERLFISVRTVESHVSALLRKLGRTDRRQLAELGGRVARTTTARPPLPDVLRSITRAGTFAGRAPERAAIDHALDALAGGGRQHLVLAVGTAGIGKSRLVAEAAVALHDRGATVGFGRCDEEALVPYQPFAEAFDSLVDHVPAEVTDRVGGALAAVVPRLRVTATNLPPPSPVESSQARYEILDAIEAVLAGVPGPVVLVVDDLQWADRPSLLALRHLLRSARRVPVLVVATARPESLRPDSGLAEMLASVDPTEVTQLELAGLGIDEVRAVAEVDFPAAAGVAADAWARTGGNPLLLRELLRHVVEEGEAALDVIGPRLRELVARRIARLDPTLVQVLTAGALAGESFRLGVASRSVDEEPAALLDGIEAAVLAGLVDEVAGEPDRYRFTHSLVRHALVQRLTSSRRLHLHLRIAEQLERAAPGEHLAEVAHHRHAALPEGDPDLAVAAARAAADEAEAAVAYEQAAALRGMALDALAAAGAPAGAQAAERLARAESLLRAGQADDARAELQAVADVARRTGDAVLLARAALGTGETAPRWGVDAELVALLEAALKLLGDEHAALRARLTARLAQALYYSADDARRRALADAAERDARRSGDAEALARVLSALHDALWGPGDVQQRVESATKIAALGDELGNAELQVHGQGLLLVACMEAGRFADARRATERHAALATALGQPLHRRDIALWQATWAVLEDRIDDAAQSIAAARELSDAARDPHGDTIYWIQQAGYVLTRDEPDELDELAAAYDRIGRELPHVPAWRSALAAVHARRGETGEAAAILDEQAADGFAALPRDGVWLNAVTYLAEAAVAVGDTERAAALRAALEPYADSFVVVDRGLWCKGSVSLFLGMLDAALGDRAGAERWFDRAAAVHDASGLPMLIEATHRRRAALLS